MESLILLDSTIFLLGCILGGTIIFLRLRESRRLTWFGLLYLVGTYSSYNIMVKPLHDFNRVVPRTAFFHLEVIGPFAPADLLGLLLLPILVLSQARYGPISFVPRFLRPILVKDAWIAMLSLIGFLTIQHAVETRLTDELLWFRGLLYYALLFCLVLPYLRDSRRPYGFRHLFFTFYWVDVVNLASGLGATLVYQDHVWQRYGFPVSIIDQDDATTIALFYLLLYIFGLGLGPRISRRPEYTLSLAVIAGLTIMNFYKTNFALAGLLIVFAFATSILFRRQIYWRTILLSAMLPLAFVGLFAFLDTGNTTALKTRSQQFRDYWHFATALGPERVAFGMGNGTYFLRGANPSDGGEIKAIDRARTPGLARSIQTPVLNVLKIAGVFGVAVHLLAVVAFAWRLRPILDYHPFVVVGVFYLLFKAVQGPIFLSPTIFTSFFIVKICLLLLLLTLERSTSPGAPVPIPLLASATASIHRTHNQAIETETSIEQEAGR